jgi:hypothetical protein
MTHMHMNTFNTPRARQASTIWFEFDIVDGKKPLRITHVVITHGV